MQVLLKITAWGIILYSCFCGFLFLIQRQILFPRNQIPFPSTAETNITGLEKIWVETEFGKIESWFIPPAPGHWNGRAPAVIFGHGNAELIDFWPDELKKFAQIGIGLLMVEYPGYGRSAGRPSQQSITQTFIAAYDALTSRKDVDPSRIILFGRSVGGGAVCALAAQRPSAALILMSAFTSVRPFASKFLVPKFLVRDPFDNLAVVRNYAAPVLIIHGKNDTIIPFLHGTVLHKAAPNSKMIVYDAGHNDCPPDWKIFWKDIELFLRSNAII